MAIALDSAELSASWLAAVHRRRLLFLTGLIVYYFAMRQPAEDNPPAE